MFSVYLCVKVHVSTKIVWLILNKKEEVHIRSATALQNAKPNTSNDEPVTSSVNNITENNFPVKGYSIRDNNAALEPSSSEGAKRLNASGIVKNIDNSDGFMSCLHNKRAIPVRHGSCFLTPNRFIIAY